MSIDIGSLQTALWMGLKAVDWSQAITGGIIAGIGLFSGNRLLHYVEKPKISIIKSKIIPIEFHIKAYDINDPYVPFQYRSYSVKYTANRVVVRNKRSTAAEGSKGALRITRKIDGKIEESEYKVRWIQTIEQYKMTINADSEEYLDVCAVYTQDRSKLFKELMNHIENCERYVRENVPNLGIKEPILLQIEDIKTKYNTWSDIPLIVAPTENGWPPLNVSRKIEPSTDSISYNLIVTSKNSNKINKKIRIKETPDSEGRVIEFL